MTLMPCMDQVQNKKYTEGGTGEVLWEKLPAEWQRMASVGQNVGLPSKWGRRLHGKWSKEETFLWKKLTC